METKNIIRQNFIADDVGANKAQVLSERYTELYPHLKVSFVDKYATYAEFDSQYLKDNTYSPDHFVDIASLGIQPKDILINLVDNEGFKKKLDVFTRRSNNFLFAAGVNLYNGQAYFTTNQETNGYVMDHADLLNIFDEVSVHACADTDANGADDNPEQLFNGNDVAASVLANLYQVVLTDIPLFKRINFVTGVNMNAQCGDKNYSLLLYWIKRIKSNNPEEDLLQEQARRFVELIGLEQTTQSAKKYYEIYHRGGKYSKFTSLFSG